jgi:pimeloyl-ACP methyl ester carboxylesterase
MNRITTLAAPQRLRLGGVLQALAATVLIAAGLLLGAAKVAQARLAAEVASPPGQLVDIGGRRLHIHCQGAITPAQPTIVLEAGLGELSLTWAGVAPALAESHRVCAYDRAGYGWSDPAPGQPSAAATVTDLHTLLNAAGEPGPYLLVGHSLGGLYARLFAHRYPDEVAGLALLDPSHEEMTSRLPADWQVSVRQANDEAVAALRIPALLADLGLAALFPQLAPADPRLPSHAQADLRALAGVSGRGFRALASEIGASEAVLAEMRAEGVTDLGDLPLVVVKAGASAPAEPPPGLSPFAPSYDLHAELVAQSSRGRLVVLEASTHYVHYDAPERVRDVISGLLEP